MTARLGTSLQAVLNLAGVRLKRDPDQVSAPVAVVHLGGMEEYARTFNLGFAEAVEQFGQLLVEVRDDLSPTALATDVLRHLDDVVKAMGGGR